MRKLNLFVGYFIFNILFWGCTKEEGDREKIVNMTIYPETGYGASVMSDIITEPMLYSDSENNEKRIMLDIITEGFDFEYERGYMYILKVKKTWMQNPPQDVSSIKYEFIELVSKEKVITEDSEEDLELFVSSETVKFSPRYPTEFENEGIPKIYDALYVKAKNTVNWMALTEIEGFNYEEGYEYRLNVKKITQANPYSVKYVLVNILSKDEKN